MTERRHLCADFIIEEDRRLGKPIFHIFPSHQEHITESACPCGPHICDFYEWEPGVFVELWWHSTRRRDDAGI